MQTPQWHCAFLSTENVRSDLVDDHHAIAPLNALGVAVQTHPWRATDVDWSQFDLVIVRSTWDYHDHVAGFFEALERIEASDTRLANPREVMHWNRRKTYLAELEAAGVPIVDTVFGSNIDEQKIDALARQFDGVPWIIKPDISASAEGVIRLSGAPTDEQREAMRQTFADRGYLAQPFVEDVVTSGEYSVFYFDAQYSHCILKTPKTDDFRVQEEHGGHIRAVAPPEELMQAAEHVRTALPGRCLYERLDFVRAADGTYRIMEVELIEPSLYLRTQPAAATHFADAVVRWLQRS
jgi:glutathione synthase/RimK-type ligase-like ATP-grasp enzyme